MIFEKIYLDRKVADYFYILMMGLLKLIYFLVLGAFVYFLWEYRHSYMELFETEKIMRAHQYKNWSEYLKLGEIVGWETVYVVVKIIILSFLIKALRNAPIPRIWLKKWDEDGQVDRVFGRKLVRHLRFYRRINFKDFHYIHEVSRKENYNLFKMNKDENLSYIMKKYDDEFEKDIL